MKYERPEMVGAATEPVTLTGTPATASVSIQPASGPAAAAASAAQPAGKTYLKIENVVSERSHAAYEVYVNLPEGADAEQYQEHYAGKISLFGVMQASRQTEQHAGNGLAYSMDITKVVDRLKAKNAWDDRHLNVTFVPRRKGGTAEAAVPGHHPIHVGRVSLYQA